MMRVVLSPRWSGHDSADFSRQVAYTDVSRCFGDLMCLLLTQSPVSVGGRLVH